MKGEKGSRLMSVADERLPPPPFPPPYDVLRVLRPALPLPVPRPGHITCRPRDQYGPGVHIISRCSDDNISSVVFPDLRRISIPVFKLQSTIKGHQKSKTGFGSFFVVGRVLVRAARRQRSRSRAMASAVTVSHVGRVTYIQ